MVNYRYKYSREDLAVAVASSVTVSEVMSKLGITPAGGSHSHLSRRIKKEGLDTSHFDRYAHLRTLDRSNRKTTPQQILIVRPEGSNRESAFRLRRALLAIGRDLICESCALTDWLGKPIVLSIDHIDGNWLDCRADNLRFLCPNCHSQTETYGRKKSSPPRI